MCGGVSPADVSNVRIKCDFPVLYESQACGKKMKIIKKFLSFILASQLLLVQIAFANGVVNHRHELTTDLNIFVEQGWQLDFVGTPEKRSKKIKKQEDTWVIYARCATGITLKLELAGLSKLNARVSIFEEKFPERTHAVGLIIHPTVESLENAEQDINELVSGFFKMENPKALEMSSLWQKILHAMNPIPAVFAQPIPENSILVRDVVVILGFLINIYVVFYSANHSDWQKVFCLFPSFVIFMNSVPVRRFNQKLSYVLHTPIPKLIEETVKKSKN